MRDQLLHDGCCCTFLTSPCLLPLVDIERPHVVGLAVDQHPHLEACWRGLSRNVLTYGVTALEGDHGLIRRERTAWIEVPPHPLTDAINERTQLGKAVSFFLVVRGGQRQRVYAG